MVVVFNRADHDIIVRHQNGGMYKIAPNQSTNVSLGAAPELELFGVNGRDEQTTFARILVKKDTPEVHFTNFGAAFGAGQPTNAINSAAPADIGGLSFLAPRSLTAAPNEPPVAQFAPATTRAMAVPLATTTTAEAPAQAQTANSELVYVEGLGHIQKSSVPPHVLAQMQERAMTQPAQAQPQRQIPPMQFKTQANRSWLLPLGILLVLVVVLLYTFRKKIGLS